MKPTTKKILASSLGMAGAMVVGTVNAKADTTITVSAGDNLNSIAQKYNVSTDDLAAANNIQNKELIFAGQKLTIPGEDKATDNTADKPAVSSPVTGQDKNKKGADHPEQPANKAMA